MMFNPEPWATAFINSLEMRGVKTEDGIEVLRALAPIIATMPGAVFGRSAAEKMETLIREAMAKTETASDATEIVARFLVLMVRKKTIRHINAVIVEINKIWDRRNGIVRAYLEYAFPRKVHFENDDFEGRVKNAVRKKTGAAAVELQAWTNAGLIGGYRLRIGDELIDASVRAQLMKLEACLAGGN
jgi:F-type H+-transporting ATPase subunit delta